MRPGRYSGTRFAPITGQQLWRAYLRAEATGQWKERPGEPDVTARRERRGSADGNKTKLKRYKRYECRGQVTNPCLLERGLQGRSVSTGSAVG